MPDNDRKTLDKRVVSLGALRLPVRGHAEVMYGGTGIDGTPEQQHKAVDQVFRQALMSARAPRDGDYAVLDGYDVNGDIVVDYGIPTRHQFQRLYRKLNWAVSRMEDE